MQRKFLIVAIVCFILALTLSVLGEQTLFLFHGDRELAARVYKILYILLAGAIFSGIIPFIVSSFVYIVRRVFENIHANGVLTQFFLRADVPQFFEKLGFILAAIVAIAAVVATFFV